MSRAKTPSPAPSPKDGENVYVSCATAVALCTSCAEVPPHHGASPGLGEDVSCVTAVQPGPVVQKCHLASVTAHWGCPAPPACHQRQPAACRSP